MNNILLYLHLHQPRRLKNFSIFDIGTSGADYSDQRRNITILDRIVRESYLPTLTLLNKVAERFGERFHVSFSISGILLEELREFHPEVIALIRNLVWSRRASLIIETYYHSLAYIFDLEEFKYQIMKQKRIFKEIFDYHPTIFRNTEFIYNNDLSRLLGAMGFRGVFAEGADRVMQGRSPNFIYYATDNRVKVFAKNYQLSDDIAFRFSDRYWSEWPLDAEKYLQWVDIAQGDILNLMMDFETFGEHHKEGSGILPFLEHFIGSAVKRGKIFISPERALKNLSPRDVYDSREVVTWADTERDLSAWLGNELQQHATRELYALKRRIFAKKDPHLIESFRNLQTSDHFYYMCTKWFADGDVHKYFNPYESPYDAYLSFMNIVEDLKLKC